MRAAARGPAPWRTSPARADRPDPNRILALAVPRGPGWRTLTVLVEAQPDQPSGLMGDVTIEPRPQ